MKVQLIMLPQPVLVSDETKQTSDKVWNPYVQQVLTASEVFMPHGYKVIAGIPQLPSIDFSALSEDECKRIGWVNVEMLRAIALVDKNYDYKDEFNVAGAGGYCSGYMDGFQAAQSLSDKKYSLEDVKNAIQLAREIKDGKEVLELEGMLGLTEVCTHNCEALPEAEIIKRISQPRVFNVEVEKEQASLGEVFNGRNTHTMWADPKPKITNNSIKILKLL